MIQFRIYKINSKNIGVKGAVMVRMMRVSPSLLV